MSRQERLVPLAFSFQRLQLRSHIDCAVAVVTYIKRYHADGVAGNQERIPLLVVKDKGEDTAQALQHPTNLLVSEKVPLSHGRGVKGEASI